MFYSLLNVKKNKEKDNESKTINQLLQNKYYCFHYYNSKCMKNTKTVQYQKFIMREIYTS